MLCTMLTTYAENYKIWINGIQVTSENCKNVSGKGISSSGCVSYDSDTKNLDLSNITITSKDQSCIKIEEPGVTIRLFGKNTLKAGRIGLELLTDVSMETIILSNKLIIENASSEYNSIHFSGRNLELKLAFVEIIASGGKYAISSNGNDYPGSKVTVKNSKLDLAGKEGVFKWLSNVTLEECKYSNTMYKVMFEDGCLYTNGEICKRAIVEPKEYGLTVASLPINSINKYDILYGNSNGKYNYKINFNDKTRTLTFKDGTDLTTSYYSCVESHLDLHIKIEGKVKLTVSKDADEGQNAIKVFGFLTIEGEEGSELTIVSKSKKNAAILVSKGLGIQGCKVNIISEEVGINGDEDNTDMLLIDCALDITSAKHAVQGITSASLRGCYLASPQDAYYSVSTHSFSTDNILNNVKDIKVMRGADNIKPTILKDGITLSQYDEKSVLVEWNPAVDNTTQMKDLSYIIKAESQTDGSVKESSIAPGTPTCKVMTDLTPGVTYKFSVTVIDEGGNKMTYSGDSFTLPIIQYGLTVGGTQVTNGNMDDVCGDGKVKFDPETYTLYLTNASISNVGSGIYTDKGSKPLTIIVNGNNTVFSLRSDALYLQGNTEIMGPSNSSLIINAGSGTGIKHSGYLKFYNCNVEATGTNYGIAATEYSNYSILIDNANVKAKGGSAAFYNYKYYVPTNVYVASPTGATFGGNTPYQSGFVKGTSMCKTVEIKKSATDSKQEAPQISNRELVLTSTDGSITVTWEAAQDTQTEKDKLEYTVYVTTDRTLASDPWNNLASSHEQEGPIMGSNDTFRFTTQVHSEGRNDVYGYMNPNTTYYVVVEVKDADNNYAYYNVGSVTTLEERRYDGPKVDDKKLKVSATDKLINVEWESAYDRQTESCDLKYYVYVSTDKELIKNAWNELVCSHDQDGPIMDCNNRISHSTNFYSNDEYSMYCGLDPNTTYYVTVIVQDGDNNRASYEVAELTTPGDPKKEAPIIANKTLTLSSTESDITVTWSPALDARTAQNQLKYYVYVSTQKALASDPWNKIECSNDQEGPIMSSDTIITYTTQVFSDKAGSMVGSMESGTTFYINVAVEDTDGNYSLYEVGKISTSVPNAVKAVEKKEEAVPTFSISGSAVNASYRGIVIKNGKKYLNK